MPPAPEASENVAPPPILLDLPEELIGPRVSLRPYRPGDGAAIWEAVEESREELLPWMPWMQQTHAAADSEAFARRACAEWVLREAFLLGIWHRETQEFLGSTGLLVRDWAVPWFEIGYWIRTPQQGNGYVTEAVQLQCDFAFNVLGANRVLIQCDARNDRSAAVARRLGFPLEGRLQNAERNHLGELRDTLVFAMTPEDYARERARWSP